MKPKLQSSNLVAAVLMGFLATSLMQARTTEQSVYLYDIQKVSDTGWLRLLNKWHQTGTERAIVSLEAGREFLLDDQKQSERLRQLFGLASRFGIRIEGLILQDPSWALDPQGARQRLRAILDFDRNNNNLIDSVQIDVEVYTPSAGFLQSEGWARYAILVSALREELRLDRSSLRLTAALPWWLPVAVSEYDLNTIYQSLDGILLMVYGDPGGTPVAADLVTFQSKVLPVIEDLPKNGPAFRVGIATYEHPSTLALYQFAQQLDLLLSLTPNFNGVTIFHEDLIS